MKLRNQLASLISALLLLASLALAQTAVVNRNVYLRQDPSTGNPPIKKLTPSAAVTLIDPDPTGGYYHVQAGADQGWLWGRNISIQETAPPSPQPEPTGTPVDQVAEAWEKVAPQSNVLHADEGDCGTTGDGGDTVTNLRKNRVDVPVAYHAVTWEAINSLPYPNGAPKSRISWTPADLAEIAKYEGEALTVEGYLYKLKVESSSASAAHGGESTNCHFRLASDVDWHMALTANAREGEDVAIVVETTPRLRQQHPNWNTAALKPWTFMIGSQPNTNYNAQKVRISGWLMLDPEHQDMINHGQRSTLWEIHPVTKIEVQDSTGTWIDLDSPE